MTHTLKYFSILLLAIAFIGCQNDSSEETTSQQTPQQQQQGPLSQMQQQAPDVDVSDEEAASFADAAMSAQQVQMEAQKKMIGLIEDAGLDIQTYQKIARSQQMGQSADSSAFSDEEMQKFDDATTSIEDIQEEIRKDVESAIKESGMEMERFQKISRAAQQDSALQMQIQQQIQQKMGGQMQQQPPQN
jgi:type II secretory pathway component PulM